jgi:restriction system protein
MFYIDVKHDGLKKFRRLSGADQYVVEQRAKAQTEAWDVQWRRRVMLDQHRNDQQRQWALFETKKAQAARVTAEAQESIASLEAILLTGLKGSVLFRLEMLYDKSFFTEAKPVAPVEQQAPREPDRNDQSFAVVKDLWSWLLPSVKRNRDAAAQSKYDMAHRDWQKAKNEIASQNAAGKVSYEASLADREVRKQAFEKLKQDHNAKIDAFRAMYMQKDPGAVAEYIDTVLSRPEYPDFFPKQWDMDFISETGVLIVDYELPPIDDFPTLKAVKYIQSRDVLEQSLLRDSEIARVYDAAIYQTCLRTLHEVFETDEADALASVTFNGWVNFTDKATGKPARACIMSVQTTKATFQQINLNAVDPKVCFRALKGVGSAKLAGMSAVVPILRLKRTDDRFVPAHDVIETVLETTNIAAIPWEEFEYLVRDIFEKEFSKGGGEVKITRASRDQGVDAIAFDPDPIRGGKIVIQAKRYTNVVGVSAVRDLYGTLMNEGANRGILVTTSQYGPDSYEFAAGKPITLLDGGNLLSLLEKHGHRARIDLAEAKRIGIDRENYTKR